MDEGFPGLRQKKPDAYGKTQETNMAPSTFNMNQNFAVVFPLLSESQRLVWVHSNEIDLQLLDCVAELDQAFDSFPYLTQKQTAVVAQRCSLHPDQVKVWFMLQRLRYGISWDYKDIQDLRKKFKNGHGKALSKEELQSMNTREKKKRGKVKESGLNKVGKGRKEHVGKIKGEKVKNAEQLERKVMQEKPINQEKNSKVEKTDEEDWCPQKKRKRRTGRNKIEKKLKQDGDGAVERAEEETRGDRVKMEGEKPFKSKKNLPIGTEKRTMMRLAFLNCQYPNSEDFSHLTALIGIPRSDLVQWFSDMRYYVKNRRPLWMSQEQHRQALANIQQRQNIFMWAKEAVNDFRGEKTQEKMKT
ncbi:homeobox and leucine zipper encoding b [Solea solea]|uniref:homeobox and leucine zipper encoding b n=1 Tax=Solea solea TaxID=90069 RepID=UPI00272C7AD9|nr:homeobox and leucine zipper encoding b [Solea solea]